MGSVRSYRDLIVWQRAMEFVEAVYEDTTTMPRTEQFGLVMQVRRAVVSIPSNIAEGYARGTRREYLRYLRIARASLAEASTQLELMTRLKLLLPGQQSHRLAEEVSRILQALITSLE